MESPSLCPVKKRSHLARRETKLKEGAMATEADRQNAFLHDA